MIQVENLTKFYGDLCAVDNISFDMKKGEILGILGPNGAGKTTTLRMLTGFLRPTSGSIRVKDYSIDENALAIKELMGYLPESAPLYHEMLVYDYLDYVADIRGLNSDAKLPQIRKLSGICGLNTVMHQPIGELSKGFKQRVGLAHAMMNDPEILVLDEPTSGLDPNQIVEIRDIIKQIGKEKTIVLSTHILSEAEATCDRIVIIDRGKIAADGSTDTLKQAEGGEYLVTLALQNADAHSVTANLSPIQGITDVLSTEAGQEGDAKVLRVKLTCRTDKDLRPEIYATIKTTDWILLELFQETKSLEHIFRELTKEN
jgi:ABC-2 type transport system ATP-binding protein